MKEEVEAGKERKGRRQKKSFTSFSVHGHPLYWDFCSAAQIDRQSVGDFLQSACDFVRSTSPYVYPTVLLWSEETMKITKPR